jgi:hypothetical protein
MTDGESDQVHESAVAACLAACGREPPVAPIRGGRNA